MQHCPPCCTNISQETDLSDNNTNTNNNITSEERRNARIEAKRRRLAQKRAEGRIRTRRPLPPKAKFRIFIIVIALILAVWGIVSLSDYLSKRPDYRVTDEGYTHAEKFANAVPIFGIDISEHQDADIRWEKVKSSGVDFVFIRAGYRGADKGDLHIDSNFEENIKGAEKAGLMVGVYFYSQALDAQEGKEEADFVLELVKPYDLTLPIVIDYEIYNGGRLHNKIQSGDMYAASFYHDAVLGFCNEVEEAGYESAVYANKDMLTNYMQADLLDDSATLWLAAYGSSVDLDADYWFWQCTDSALAGGIDEKVDQDFWYMEPGKVYPTRASSKVKEEKRISAGEFSVVLKEDPSELHHFRSEPSFKVTYKKRKLREGRDYIASVVKNTEEGTGYIILRGIGKYKDWVMHPFRIEK